MKGWAFSLIALAVGYYVLLAAAKEKKETKRLGQVIGWIIIIFSVLGIWCSAQICFQTGKGDYSCPFSGKGKAMQQSPTQSK